MMAHDNGHLARLQSIQACQAIMDNLTAHELFLVALLMDGHERIEIAEMLGVTQEAVNYHIRKARQRLAENWPELVRRYPIRRRRERDGHPNR